MPRPVLPSDTVLNLYVPSGARPLMIADGSAIVGLPNGEGDDCRIEAYYEGAVHGQRMDFEEKLQHAAGRMLHRAPTTSFGFYDVEDLMIVGEVARSERLHGWIVTNVIDRQALDDWAGEDVPAGGSDTLRQRAAGIAWGRMSPAEQMQLQMRSQAGRPLSELVLDTI